MAFVVSAGQLAQLSRHYSRPVTSVRLSSELSMDYATLYRSQAHVRTVVEFLARNIAQIGLHAFERVSDTDRQRVTGSPLTKLLSTPNPRTTQYRFIEAVVSDMAIYSVACWLKVRTDGDTAGLVRLPPSRIAPMGDSWLWPERIKFTGNRGKREFDLDEVLLIRGYNPEDSIWGVSPIESLRQVLAGEFQAAQAREQMWRNGARFPGYIERPPMTPWSAQARDRFKDEWRAVYTGTGSDAGGTPILEDGMEFKPSGITPLQAQYLETRKLTREEVAAAYHIPPPMVGVLEHATFANIEEQHRNLYQDTLGPWLSMIEQEIALQLIPEFDRSGKLYVEFNLAEKLRGTFEEQSRAFQSAVGRPYMTADEARGRMNLPALGGDAAQLVTPLNVLVGGQASPTDSGSQNQGAKSISPRVKAAITDPQRDKITQVIAAFMKRQKPAVLSALGGGGDWWDGDRWDAELADDLSRVTHAIASILGPVEAERLGFADGYDPDMTVNFLKAVAERHARNINLTTLQQLQDQLASDEPDPGHVFDVGADSRAKGIAGGIGTFVAAFASVEAAKQIGEREGRAAVKTWLVTSSRPRPTHAAMNGETVPVGTAFSNQMMWPGDSSDADEVAGCSCVIVTSFE